MANSISKPISVWTWIIIAGAILMVITVTALVIKHVLVRRKQKKQQILEDGNRIFGHVITHPMQAHTKHTNYR